MGALLKYENRIVSLHNMFGSRCWLILYQCDVRARGEHALVIWVP